MTATGLSCGSCGTELSAKAKFCSECGAAVSAGTKPAEYKQVTVLFADVVHSMDIAAAVGAERLREIMTELVNRSASVVQRFGGTVDKFTGDGIMAVFGAPAALEDHAARACLAALDIQNDAQHLAMKVDAKDGIALQLRVGLNSGQVIAGEIGSAAAGYTAIGEQVGMAQRIESVAPPGGVMLSESTARLVQNIADLGDAETVRIKGFDTPVLARQLRGVPSEHERAGPAQSTLVGRELEVHTMSGLLDRSISGRGCVVGVVGAPGIGKSRLVREAVDLAKSLGVKVFSTYCESHASQIPFHAAARMMRSAGRISGLDDQTARARVRAQNPNADADDLLLLDDLLGIADPEATLPRIDPDARRRRLTALINTANLARTEPVLYVMEDVHWIDEVSESLMADVLAVMGQMPAMALITYRPEYDGALARVHGAQAIALTPLTNSESAALIGELLGPDPSVDRLAPPIVSRVGGNPFFAEEMVRELAQRGVLDGERGDYVCHADVAEVIVPGTVQATIAARIDRLDPLAKRTLSAAAVIGLQFSPDLLTDLGVEPVFDELVRAELIDQVRFTPHAEYAFHHPLVRAVAYESQLKSDRAEWHRRVAAAVQTHDPDSVEESAALIAEHLEAAGDLRAAYRWHMRAGTWSIRRDVSAARLSWQRARQIADALPDTDPDRTPMRIAPRTKLCGSAWRGVPNIAGLVEELRDLCAHGRDNASLAIGLAALALQYGFDGKIREAQRLADEHMSLLKSSDNPTLTIGATSAAVSIKHETGDMTDILRWSQDVIDWADANLVKGNPTGWGSALIALALVWRGIARWWLGRDGWQRDLDDAVALAPNADPITHPSVVMWKYLDAIAHGVLLSDDTAVRELEGALRIAQATGEEVQIGTLKNTLGRALADRDALAERQRGLEMLTEVRKMCLQRRFSGIWLPILDLYAAREQARLGDSKDAIATMQKTVGDLFATGQVMYGIWGTTVLVETLLQRGGNGEVADAQGAIDRLADVPDNAGGVVRDIWLLRLRALLARAHGDAAAYAHFRDRYRDMAKTLGFEGHIAWAEAMP
jgi:class 3 adenylate cyclase